MQRVAAEVNTFTHEYNNMDRLATRTDPLNRSESFIYDPNGNLTQFIETKLQEAITLARYGYRDSAMRALGQALHTAQDRTAHAGRDPQGTLLLHALGKALPWFFTNPDNPRLNPAFFRQAQEETEELLKRFQRGRGK